MRESAATPGLTSVPTSVRDLMAPGSEHLQQMRESLAVVNGRRGSSEKPLPSAPLSAAVLDTRWQRLPQGGGCISEGPTEPADPEPADPERPCRAEAPGWEGALYFINIDANAGEVCGRSLHKVTLSGVRGFYTSSRLDEGLSGPEPPKLKTTMEKSVQVTTSARLGDEGQWSPVPAAGELGHGEQAARGGGTRTRSATLCTHLQVREGPGQREGVEKGAGATWKVLYRGDGEKKAQGQCPQTMHTKCSLCSTEERVRQEARAPGTTALRSCGGGLRVPLPATPPGGLGQTSPRYSHNGKRSTRSEQQNHGASTSPGLTLLETTF